MLSYFMLLHIKVNPGSNEESLTKRGNTIIVKLKQKAEKGKANLALLRLLSKQFSTPIKDIRIVRGIKSRNKVVVVGNENKDDLND